MSFVTQKVSVQVDVKNERFFGPMTSCHPFFFIPIVAIDFRSDDQDVHACFHVSYFEKRHVVHTYRLGWRMLVCWKINGIFVTKQSIDCFGCGLSKRQFWKIVAVFIFHRSRFASDFCANVDGQYILFFCLVQKTIDTTDNCFWRDKRMWRFIVRPNLTQISAKKAGHVAAFFRRESSPFCRIKGMSFYLTKVREHLKRNV